MRTDHSWFSDRASTIWKARPGRSFLVVTPHGCNETSASSIVKAWCQTHFTPPSPYINCETVYITIVSDDLTDSRHFAKRLASAIQRACDTKIEFDKETYTTDIVLDAIEAALACGKYPVMLVTRFHAFAQIKDGGMNSVLSQLRTLEMDGKLTTITFSPMTYNSIRRTMDGSHAFLNSVYGDAHDEASISPISRAEFTTAADSFGIPQSSANEAFSLGGGPDSIFEALIDGLISGTNDLVAHCVKRCDVAIGEFLSKTLDNRELFDGQLLGGLCIGRLELHEEAAILTNSGRDFLSKRSKGGALVCSSPVLSRWILSKRAGTWGAYGACIQALREDDWRTATEAADALPKVSSRLEAFRQVARLHAALVVDVDRPFFGIDWAQAWSALSKIDVAQPEFVGLKEMMLDLKRWFSAVRCLGADRMQADKIALASTSSDVRNAMQFLTRRFVTEISARGEGSHLLGLINVPEMILQAISVGVLDIDFSNAPEEFEQADYQQFFCGAGEFQFPKPGTKIALGSLIVIVPCLLQRKGLLPGGSLTNSKAIVKLQGRLIDRVRNPASHTLVDFAVSDLKLLRDVCIDWTSQWISIDRDEVLHRSRDFPSVKYLESILCPD